MAGPPVRLAGLYALERLAQDHVEQRQTIVNVLCAYLRMPNPLPGDPPGDDADDKVITEYRGRVQEREVRLAAQRILAHHLRPGDDPNNPAETFWADIHLDLTGAALIDLDFRGCQPHAATFTQTLFTGNTWFGNTTFTDPAYFNRATFAGNADFRRTTFADTAYFEEVTFNDETVFSFATLPATPISKRPPSTATPTSAGPPCRTRATSTPALSRRGPTSPGRGSRGMCRRRWSGSCENTGEEENPPPTTAFGSQT